MIEKLSELLMKTVIIGLGIMIGSFLFLPLLRGSFS